MKELDEMKGASRDNPLIQSCYLFGTCRTPFLDPPTPRGTLESNGWYQYLIGHFDDSVILHHKLLSCFYFGIKWLVLLVSLGRIFFFFLALREIDGGIGSQYQTPGSL